EVSIPVGDARVEDRPEQLVSPDLRVERVHEALDHRGVDAGSRHDVGDDRVAPFGYRHGSSGKLAASLYRRRTRRLTQGTLGKYAFPTGVGRGKGDASEAVRGRGRAPS